MAVPARRVSSARRDSRRKSVSAIKVVPELMRCPECGEYKAAHTACPSCGKYNGRQVFNVEDN